MVNLIWRDSRLFRKFKQQSSYQLYTLQVNKVKLKKIIVNKKDGKFFLPKNRLLNSAA